MSTERSVDEASPLLGRPGSPITPEDAGSRKAQTRLVFRIAAALYSFFVLGLFVSSIGVMLPRISKYYFLSDLKVSLIFLVGPVGYVLAAQSNSLIHWRAGQRGIAILGPIFQLLSAGALAAHPPFHVVLVAFAIAAVGTGLLDGSWCAWAGYMSNANTVSGLLHGSFSVGAAAGPFLASIMMATAHRPWYEWYYVLLGASALELIVLFLAFRHEDAQRYRHDKHTELTAEHHTIDSKAIFKHRATWMAAAYFLADVGLETAISGWIVSFMARARHATPYLSNLSSSGFWAGMAAGRLALGAVTDRLGVSRATTGYIFCVALISILFAAVRVPAVSIALMTLLGFFMGPLFPSGVVVLTRLLPKELHVAAVSFVASVGQVGGALFPFGIGAVVQGLGIRMFQYAIIVLSTLILVLWVAFARLRPTASLVPEIGTE